MKATVSELGQFKYKTVYIKDKVTGDAVFAHLANHPKPIYGLDIETSKKSDHKKAGLDPYLSDIRLVQIYDGETVFVFDRLTADIDNPLAWFLNHNRCIAHNGCFELKHLSRRLLEPKLNIECSMLMAMLVDRAEHSPFEPDELEELDEEEKPKSDHKYKNKGGYGLDACVAREFGLAVDKSFQVSDWGKKNLSPEQISYAALDAVLTFELGKKLLPKIQMYKMMRSYKLLRSMQYVLTEMELNGFGIDIDALRELTFEWGEKVRESDKVAKKYFGKLNLNSPKQLGEWLTQYNPKLAASWPKTEKGAYTFSRNKISEHWKFPPIAALLEYKKWSKLFNTYGEALIEKIHPVTRRVHCSFFLGETRTGRLSARDPNLQNQPRDGELRKVFRANERNSLVVADFSQIEMRVAGELSKDGTMLRAFQNGIDLHKAIVATLAKKPIAKVTDDERQLGKAINFGLLFGMGPKKLKLYAKISYDKDLTEEQAYEAWRIFHERMYPKYSAWCEIQRRNCERLGYVRTPMGKMRKLLPDEAYTRSVNTPVQGGAAEVAYCGLVRLQQFLKNTERDEYIKLVNMVHDEIILEVTNGSSSYEGGTPMPTSALNPRESMVQFAGKLLVDCMTKGYLDVFPNGCTTGLAEAYYGDTWFNAKDKKTRKPCL